MVRNQTAFNKIVLLQLHFSFVLVSSLNLLYGVKEVYLISPQA